MLHEVLNSTLFLSLKGVKILFDFQKVEKCEESTKKNRKKFKFSIIHEEYAVFYSHVQDLVTSLSMSEIECTKFCLLTS